MKLISFFITIVLFFSLTLQAAFSFDFQKGFKAYQDGNIKTALQEFEKGIKVGNSNAQYLVGLIYLIGQGVEKDKKRAFNLLSESALQNNKSAQFTLGVMHLNGDGAPKEPKTAAKLFSLASLNGGHAPSEFNLGILYMTGNGVEKNYENSKNYFFSAAMKDHERAFKNLKVLADNGLGSASGAIGTILMSGTKKIPSNPNEAINWWLKGAENGDAMSMFSLGQNHVEGRHLPVDLPRAYMWFFLSQENLKTKDVLLKEQLETSLDKLKKQMSESEFSNAEFLVRSCKFSKFKECD